jgi:hypothetical protein
MTNPDANTQDTHPAVTTHPLLGVAGVLLDALIATCTGRLMSVGLADIRGTLHFGVDEGAWINSAFNVSMIDRAAKALGRRFSSRPIGWQSLTAFFSGHILCGVPRGGSFMSKMPTQDWQVTAAPVEAK